MSKKIVAIGGGENGRLLKDGTYAPYETAPMDKEIIKLTGKEKPNFLFIGHSQPIKYQKGYFETMERIYNGMYNCECKMLKSTELTDEEKVKELIDWADIIYEGGGNTLDMIKLWQKTGFDKVLKEAWENGKVMCGVSAGADCWFKECSTDSLRILYGNDQPLIGMECLGFIPGFFTPHCDESDRFDSTKEILKDKNTVGLLMSNCAAIEIIDDKYRLITSDGKYHGIDSYGLKTYWKDGEYIVQNIDTGNEFKNLSDLLSMNDKKEKVIK